MKLSKKTTIAITSASAVIYGMGVFFSAARVSAQDFEIVSPEISQQIQSVLGEADSDELLVDALSQVESQLREYGVSVFSPQENDSANIAELKQLRRSYIQQLRQRLQTLDESERQEFLAKIRARRTNVRSELVQIRTKRLEEISQQNQDRFQAQQEDLQERRELFKQNLQARLDAAKERQRPADEKFRERLEVDQQRIEEKNSQPVVKKAIQIQETQKKRNQVQGAIDYQPQNILERIGYWLTGK